MQSIKKFSQWLLEHANSEHYLFTFNDLRCVCSELSAGAFKTLLSRAVQSHILTRACRGIYLYKKMLPRDGLLLYHIASLLRAGKFNYISLETALSDMGVISQIPINRISIMSSGRSNTIFCGEFGTIEFVHTNQESKDLLDRLTYDQHCGMWRADVGLALRDMKIARRNCDLIDWNITNELIR